MPLKILGQKQKITHIIGVAAGKGGVGKSSFTTLLAHALNHSGLRVGILDADLYGPSIRKMMPEEQMPQQKGQKIVPAISNGIQYISLAFFRNEQQASVVRAPIANGMILQFLQDVEWDNLDILLIDFPPGTGDIQITLAQKAELTGAIIVTTPQEVALLDVKKCIDMFEQVHVPVLGIIENMSYFQQSKASEKIYIFGQGGGKRLAQEKELLFLGEIPLDPSICQHLDMGKTLIYPKFIEIGSQLISQIRGVRKPSSFEIEKLYQSGSREFTIEWKDGRQSQHILSELQQHCPCAKCLNGESDPPDPNVSAKTVQKVGRYAIKIDFTSGCSHGIYEYNFLRAMSGLDL